MLQELRPRPRWSSRAGALQLSSLGDGATRTRPPGAQHPVGSQLIDAIEQGQTLVHKN